MASSGLKLRHKNGSSHSKQMRTEDTRPFVKPGDYDDEVSLVFKDGKTLYVAKTFLLHMSPVFVAMFNDKSDFMERKTKLINMEDKNYDSMLLLLLSLHPRVQEKVTGENAYMILPLAEEYMIDGTIEKCHSALLDVVVRLREKQTQISSMFYCRNTDEDLAVVVQTLLFAKKYNIGDVCKHARNYISHIDIFPAIWGKLYEKIRDEDKVKIFEARMQRKKDTIVPYGRSESV